jgi:hypothetical protein
MTTVINLNILNFFKLQHNSSTVNDNRTITLVSDNRTGHYPEREDVIDITPSTSMVIGNETAMKRDITFPLSKYSPADEVMGHERANTMYDRRGNRVSGYHPKGVYVDSYA